MKLARLAKSFDALPCPAGVVRRRLVCRIMILLTASVLTGRVSPAQSTALPPAVLATPLTVTTTITALNADAPSSVHWAVFDQGIAYDLSQSDTHFVTIFDFPRDEIVLLDRTAQLSCSLSMPSLVQTAVQMQAEVKDAEKRKKLGMDAEVIAVDANQLAIRFPGADYVMRVRAAALPEHATLFGRYVDWTCRLSLVRPSGLPPLLE